MSLCSYPGCGRAAAGWSNSRLCRAHANRLYHYGAPDGRPLPRPWLIYWATKARRVLEQNADHPGIRIACSELQRLMARSRALVAADDRSDPTARPWSMLAAEGVTPTDVLAMVGAVALFDRDQPRFLSNTEAYQLAVARAVCAYLPRRLQALNKTSARCLGSMLVDRYAALTAGVLKAIDDTDAASKNREAAMSAPLSTP